MNKLINFFDRSVKYVEPFLVLFAITLVLLDVYTFFKHVVPDILHHSGRAVAGAHVVWSMWLLFNVFWNQLHCTLTSPGNTLEVQEQALQSAMTYDWRWCRTCNRGKPPLAHHCSVCNKCVLKMDHHCVWMANCVGFYNYRFFVLFLFYMWVGSAYSAAVLWLHVPVMLRLSDPTWEQAGFLPFFMFVLSCSIWLAMCVLLGWHVWLVLTGQGTIDYLDNADRAAEARAAGRRWSNPYHLGLAANWQETFDVRGRWWWLTWMAPSRRRKLGNGYNLKKQQHGGAPPSGLMTLLRL
ncbi:hypothetical protein VOLCADRAFT_90898 [Volvox carteri f. nagariensis]|uniref:S-acyltransferase n=1 Tax=Volvox carteri f. nagariensis TaxID=3068 RepID=D8TVC8_VOLCA|nr:uncharacterized protein VOLCADRAFT_90898 [Volvox carteri f. nagariensis]EFJ48556.1 hypothetical protein VOLCADRAFT_90898 [Volvox carteri f. nagariensis]|eukprot:XP_002950355.1 hypothetical protein VOLCADRAFT_90898 [Volvox carteri f. nagariensis]